MQTQGEVSSRTWIFNGDKGLERDGALALTVYVVQIPKVSQVT